MVEVDGSQGEGGGQMVRSSLALSIITGIPVRLYNIRANRSPSGLKRQHLTCVQAAATVCNAQVEGARLGAKEVSFQPQAVEPGNYQFDIGTAGSTSLVAQTIALPLALADQDSKIVVSGGTYNTMAPPFDFLAEAYFPLLNRMGFEFQIVQRKPGFYPRGGGEIELTIGTGNRLRGLQINERGKLQDRKIVSVLGRLPEHIGETEIGTTIRKLGWPKKESQIIDFDDCTCSGNVLFAKLVYQNVNEVITEFGKQGLPADKVASRLVRLVKTYLKTEAPVGPFLADQILLPMGVLANRFGLHSQFTTCELTQHSRTHIDILNRFLEIDVQAVSEAGITRVKIGPGGRFVG